MGSLHYFHWGFFFSLLLGFISILYKALIVHFYFQREVLSHQSKKRYIQQQMISLDQNSTTTRPSPSMTISPLTKNSGKLVAF